MLASFFTTTSKYYLKTRPQIDKESLKTKKPLGKNVPKG